MATTSDCITTDHSDPPGHRPAFDREAEIIVGDVIQALYAIRRLAILTDGDLPHACGDVETFSRAIREMAERNGKELDALLERMTGSAGIGIFDKEHIDRQETEENHG
jgi:hypothetical protein